MTGKTTKQKVEELAALHGITRSADKAAFLAGALSKIAGSDGDETLEMIADLLKARAISTDEATAMVLGHVRERKQIDPA